MILTPGSKKRFLASLKAVLEYVENDNERECIMFWTAQLMPQVVSELNYYSVPNKKPKKIKLNRTEGHDT